MGGVMRIGVVGLRVAAVSFVLAAVLQWVTLWWEPRWPFAVGGLGFLAVAVMLELMARRLRQLDRVPVFFDRWLHLPAVGALLAFVVIALAYSTLG